MDLGAFSISLSVKDLAASRTFYETFGFVPVAGDGEHWQMMRNGQATIGLFQGMFEGNILTFNPGWVAEHEALADFTDIREIARTLEEAGVTLIERPKDGTGPAHLTCVDPDGNAILIDQHVPAPGAAD